MPVRVFGGEILTKTALNCLPVLAICDPCTRRRGVLAWRYGRGVSDQRDEFTFALDLQAQDAEAAIGVVERDALDESREAIRFGLGGGVGWTC